jgi:Transglutaminase-like superfamily
LGKRGVGAATCVSDVFARAFKHGNPTTEFLHAKYNPAAALAQHLNGAPGHCVTRSGLLTTALLSVGIPARQVQVVTGDTGHNVLTVWDAESGWVSFDPSTGTVFEEDGRLLSTRRAVASDRGAARQVALAPMSGAYFATINALRQAGEAPELLYPEPWLYTRVGERRAAWPFRGLFVHTGATQWSRGAAQGVLRWAIALLLGLSVLLAVRPRRPGQTLTAGPLGEPVEVGS